MKTGQAKQSETVAPKTLHQKKRDDDVVLPEAAAPGVAGSRDAANYATPMQCMQQVGQLGLFAAADALGPNRWPMGQTGVRVHVLLLHTQQRHQCEPPLMLPGRLLLLMLVLLLDTPAAQLDHQ